MFYFSAQEVKEHPFFKGIDWNQVYLQKYPPPLIPPRGEVNAADAFDIGSFDEEDTKGIKVRTTRTYSFDMMIDVKEQINEAVLLLRQVLNVICPGHEF